MSATTYIDFTVPEGWHTLTETQMRYVYSLLAGDYTSTEVKVLCLLRFNKAVVLSHATHGGYWVKYQGKIFVVTPLQVAEILTSLDWLDTMPLVPVRPQSLGCYEAVAADFSGVPFGTFLAVDNYYQGYLQTHRDDLLTEIFRLVYVRKNRIFPPHDPTPSEKVAVFYWIAALKGWLSAKFTNLFAPASADESNMLGTPTIDIEGAMNAQIRALTKGDVTKEKEILAMDTLRALTELDAQAREYNEFNAKYGKK